jgi:hypothetical protein
MKHGFRWTSVAVVAVMSLSLGAVGCERAATEHQAAGSAQRSVEDFAPEELGQLGARLEAQPEAADEILEAEGLTWEEFGQAVRDIAADAERAARYEEGYWREAARLGVDDEEA